VQTFPANPLIDNGRSIEKPAKPPRRVSGRDQLERPGGAGGEAGSARRQPRRTPPCRLADRGGRSARIGGGSHARASVAAVDRAAGGLRRVSLPTATASGVLPAAASAARLLPASTCRAVLILAVHNSGHWINDHKCYRCGGYRRPIPAVIARQGQRGRRASGTVGVGQGQDGGPLVGAAAADLYDALSQEVSRPSDLGSLLAWPCAYTNGLIG